MAEMLAWLEPRSKLLAHALLPLHQRPFVGGAPVIYVGAISGIALDVDTVTDAAAFSVVCACAGTPSAHRPRGIGTQSPTPAALRGRYQIVGLDGGRWDKFDPVMEHGLDASAQSTS